MTGAWSPAPLDPPLILDPLDEKLKIPCTAPDCDWRRFELYTSAFQLLQSVTSVGKA